MKYPCREQCSCPAGSRGGTTVNPGPSPNRQAFTSRPPAARTNGQLTAGKAALPPVPVSPPPLPGNLFTRRRKIALMVALCVVSVAIGGFVLPGGKKATQPAPQKPETVAQGD